MTLENQRKQLNELQVRCEFTESDMIKGNRELNKKKNQKQKLTMQYQEIDQSNVGLKTKHNQLEQRVMSLKSSIGSPVTY